VEEEVVRLLWLLTNTTEKTEVLAVGVVSRAVLAVLVSAVRDMTALMVVATTAVEEVALVRLVARLMFGTVGRVLLPAFQVRQSSVVVVGEVVTAETQVALTTASSMVVARLTQEAREQRERQTRVEVAVVATTDMKVVQVSSLFVTPPQTLERAPVVLRQPTAQTPFTPLTLLVRLRLCMCQF